MITTTIIDECTKCGSIHLVKNGRTPKGKQKFHCRECGAYGTLNPEVKYSPERKEEILRAYHERSSLRGIERTFGVSRQTVLKWLKKANQLTSLAKTLVASEPDDVLELDELWSFGGHKENKRWIWVALCRRTRQVVSYFIGDHSEESCRRLWQWIPATYRHCQTFSDFWETYQTVFGTLADKHESVGKETGETAHVARWNNTLRQRLGRFVRKTLSFSKSDEYHEIALKLFRHEYNLRVIS